MIKLGDCKTASSMSKTKEASLAKLSQYKQDQKQEVEDKNDNPPVAPERCENCKKSLTDFEIKRKFLFCRDCFFKKSKKSKTVKAVNMG